MKTLDEVEARIPVNSERTPGNASAVFAITNSGSYYVTGNVYGETGKSGIVIEADNVTLDLNGYSLIGTTTNSLDGIRPGNGYRRGLTIRNGHITGWGGSAINSYVGDMFNPDVLSYCNYLDIVAHDNRGGIYAGYSSSIIRCISRDNQQTGIGFSNNSGLCKDCVSESNGSYGISCAEGATIINCVVQANTDTGIYCVNSEQTIIGCTVRDNEGGGIRVSQGLIRDCTISGNTPDGIIITFSCLIQDCNIGGSSTGIRGVNLGSDGRSRIEGNNIYQNTVGISLLGSPGNCIYRNTLRNTTNLNVHASNSAPTSGVASTAGPWDNLVF